MSVYIICMHTHMLACSDPQPHMYINASTHPNKTQTQSNLFFNISFIHCGNLVCLILQEQFYPFYFLLVCAVFLCVQFQTVVWLPVLGIFNMHASVYAQDCTPRLYCQRLRESALSKSYSGRKIPCHTREPETHPYCTWLFGPTLSHIPLAILCSRHTDISDRNVFNWYVYCWKLSRTQLLEHESVSHIQLFRMLSFLPQPEVALIGHRSAANSQ